MARARQLWPLVSCALLGCGPTDRPANNPSAAVQLPPPSATVLETEERTPMEACAGDNARTACDEVVSVQARNALSDEVERLQKAMVDSRYADVGIIIELARVLLARDEATKHRDGGDDASRGRRNAMRAVAVAPDNPAAQLVLSLSLMRMFQQRPPQNLGQRALMLELLESRAATGVAAGGVIGAAHHALAGQLALERGDAAAARGAFRAALDMDPKLAVAHHGLGDAGRVVGDFDAAKKHYLAARASSPDDAGILRSLGGAERSEKLHYVAAPRVGLRFGTGPIANAPPKPVRCSAKAEKAKESQKFCAAVAALGSAKGDARVGAAGAVFTAFREMTPCAGPKAACDFVARGLLDAAQALRSEGKLSKAIATARMLDRGAHGLTGIEPFAEETQLLLGDGYFRLAIYDQSARAYTKVFTLGGTASHAAGERALGLELALGREQEARQLLRKLSRTLKLSAEKRRALEALTKSKPSEAATASPCGVIFGCMVRRLAADSRWSQGAGG